MNDRWAIDGDRLMVIDSDRSGEIDRDRSDKKKF